ncbi:hypothetical protein CEUSTIGMA_g3658.t1 [Chlamydomonas eustigma]|uniref:Large ribosomal subunit protein mL43 n=1 Tax=Chlamydomonas eustigma TaxID=1157962 RepID=A0A250WZD8_9CHLO|nr:hypothetical protein CEUSTIGMA_g3658.t1 [Chlamydomonas eustigma]|eukprot:GAX76214.1 hypothetical protein CEUSTIGMA_g3658.t1 [Chlamydomonas eustigma]
MAKYGVWMLEKLVFQYCRNDGSSQGIREFLSQTLPTFKAKNPQMIIKVKTQAHQHPKLFGYYRSGRCKPIDVKNKSSAEIEEHISWLRSSHGRDQDYKVTTSRHLSRNPSVQGMWSINTFATQLERRNARALAVGK